jgi:hypothetical protein
MTTANIAQTKVVPVATRNTPYHDDFSEDANFMRILFRPGYAVQARELTQISTILQNQIERFGNHIFKNGSLVLGGQISLDTTATHLNLQTSYANTDIIATNFSANTITYASGNVKVRAHVFGGREAISNDPPVLVIKYFTGTEFGASDTIYAPEANLYANVATTNPSGPSTLASINDGIFFINGFFVKVPAQTVIVDKFSASANAKIGLEYSDDIITEVDDTSLLDPAQESSNFQAPGAARLRVNFDLAVRSLDSEDDEQFVELLRVENGEIKKQIQFPIYSVIGDTMARRTFDESGNYTVRRFALGLNETSNTSAFELTLDPGKAYVKGYEYESIAKTSLELRKAQDTAYANGRDLTITFGNYFYVQNVSNSFNTAAMQLVDIHSVGNSFISVTNAATYNSTKLGTARVRELKYYSASNVQDTNTYSYTLSVFDTRFGNLTSNISSASANGVILYDTSAKFSSNNDAYVGSTLRITSGSGVGEAYTITSYNGSTRTVNIASNWATVPTNTSNASIDLQIHSAKTVVAHPNYTSGVSGYASANIAQSSKSSVGETFLTEPEKNRLIYRWGDAFVKAGTMGGTQDYQYTLVWNGTLNASNAAVVSIEADETFVGRSDGTGVSALTLSSYMVFRKDNGRRIALSSVSVASSPEQATLTSTSTPSGTAVLVYARVNKDPDNVNSVQKTKTLYIGNTTHKMATTTSFTQNTSSGVTTVQDSGSGSGQIVITNPSKTPREKMSLFVSDVKKITKVYCLNGAAVPATGESLAAFKDVSSAFILDTGQRDTHYDHASISLKPLVGTICGPLIVCYDYYDHTSGTGDGRGYFSLDSYTSPETYEGIPSYTTSDGEVIPLRDAIDFRPRRSNWTDTSPGYTLTGIRIPVSDTSFEADYQYFLPRKDLVVFRGNQAAPFDIIEGVSAKNPVEPNIDENSMILYKLTLDPYTLGTQNVRVQYVENKRYTMRDIGRLETRIQNLEYYQTLTILEKAAERMKILDVNGLERTKYGILADDFTTHRYGDVSNPDYFVSIDTDIGGMEPAQNPVAMTLFVASNTSTKTIGPVTTLDWTEEDFVSQTLATKFTAVQPYMLAQWVGSIKMNPPDDNWVETERVPDVIINATGQNDSLIANNTARSTNSLSTQSGAFARIFGRRRRR